MLGCNNGTAAAKTTIIIIASTCSCFITIAAVLMATLVLHSAFWLVSLPGNYLNAALKLLDRHLAFLSKVIQRPDALWTLRHFKI